MHGTHAGQQTTTRRKRVARVLAIGATAALAIVLGTAQVASATITNLSVSTTGSSAYASMAGTTYGPNGITLTLQVCDTKADGHHAQGALLVLKEDGGQGGYLSARAYGGNGTCVSKKTTIPCGYGYGLRLYTETMEGTKLLSTNINFGYFSGC